MAEPHFPTQRFAPDFEEISGEQPSFPPTMLELPSVGWVLAHHARGLSVSILTSDDDQPDAIGLLTYRGGEGDLAGMGLFNVLGTAHARMHAAQILSACDKIDAGVDTSKFLRRPPHSGEVR